MKVKGNVAPIKDKIIVTDMEFGEQTTKSGIVIGSDDGKAHGVKPRWARVFLVGPEQKDIKVGDWLLVEHGRWTRGFDVEAEDGTVTTVRMVDNNGLMAVSDEKPQDITIGQEFDSAPTQTHRPEDFM